MSPTPHTTPTEPARLAGWAVGLHAYGLWVALGLGGPASEEERAFVAAIAIAGVVLAAAPFGALARAACALAAGALVLVGPSENGRLWAYLLAGAAAFGARGRSWTACAGSIALLALVVDALPEAQALVAASFEPLLGAWLAAPGTALGPSAHGAVVAVTALIAVAWPRPGTTWRFRVACGAAIVALWALQYRLGAQSSRLVGVYAGHGHAPGLFANLPILALAASAVVGLAWRGGAPVETAERRPLRRTAAVAAAAACWGFVGWQAFQGLPLLRSEPGRSALFVNHGGFDWERPTTEEVGAFSGGMFGLLPLHLRNAGWQVDTVRTGELDGRLTGPGQVLVVINCPHAWSAPERDRVRAFLEAGGGLLVLGDHTDIFGCARGGDTLLAEYGIRFRFDSAYFLGRSWKRELEWGRAEPQTSAHAHDSGIAVGASLALEAPAYPIVTARYAFGDAGIRDNVAGAFLGNYRFEPDERLGDLCVVAGARVGRGSVRVYGDTSAFQNAALAASFHAHVAPVFERLASRGPALPWSATRWIAPVALLAALAWLTRARRSVASLWLGCWLAACAADARVRAPDVAPPPSSDAVLVDRSHAPRVGDLGAEWNEIWPLKSAALRTGALVLDLVRWDARSLAGARALVLVAPAIPFRAEERAAIGRFVADGGTLVACASGRDARALHGVIGDFGIAIAPESVGSVPDSVRARRDRPRLLDASPLEFEPRAGDVRLVEAGASVYALARPVGRGWVVVVGDTRFFSSANVESTQGDWPGNQRLLIDLCVRFLGGRLDVERETLAAPLSVDAFGQPEVP